MNRIFKKKIDVSVLITSYSQRKITLETANYFSEICNEVILVDEEQPYLSEEDVIELKKDINYIPYEASILEKEYNSPYGKRLIAAKNAKNKYVVHSNHDERYTYMGLLASVNELDNDKNLTFVRVKLLQLEEMAMISIILVNMKIFVDIKTLIT